VIAASIEQFGFINPILVDTASGILDGHARRLAELALGIKLVPVVKAQFRCGFSSHPPTNRQKPCQLPNTPHRRFEIWP
jgi:hypothetical protein